MLIYIATRGDAQGIARWRAIAAAVIAAGHQVTYDWTLDIERERARGVHDHDLTLEQRRPYAEKDFKGVFDADVFIYDAPHEKSEGAAYEMGAHHMKRDLVQSLVDAGMQDLELMLPIASIVIGDAKCLFASRSDHFVSTIDEAIAKIAEIQASDRTRELIMMRALARSARV